MPARIIQLASVARGSPTPIRCKIVSCRYRGMASWYFETAIWASKPGEAMLLGIGWAGRGAVLMHWPHVQAYFLRICRITWIFAGMISSCSEMTASISASN